MKFLLVSDTHLEFYGNQRSYENGPLNWLPDPAEYDIALLPGDIGTAMAGIDAFRRLIPAEKLILFCPGNHELYSRDLLLLDSLFKYTERKDNVKYLSPGAYYDSDKNITIIGATLWSKGYLSIYEEYFTRYEQEQLIQRSINDFRVIKWGAMHDLFSVQKMQVINRKEIEYIEKELEKASRTDHKVVVMTHFMPSVQCIASKYKDDPINGYFCNELDYLIDEYKPDIWAFGHTHERIDFIHSNGKTRLVSNPLGYPAENKEPFKYKIIEV